MKSVSFAVAVLLGHASATIPEPKELNAIPEPKAASSVMMMAEPKLKIGGGNKEPKILTVMPSAKEKKNIKKIKMMAVNEQPAAQMYYTYTGTDSTWFSPTLRSDGYGYTSYDYTYRNSYSYDVSTSDVVKWDYATNDWNVTSQSGYSGYDSSASTWYSSTLHSDGYGTHTSYDYTYMNSYSYNTNYGQVSKWDYSTWDWNTSTSTYGDYSYDPSLSSWYSSSLQSDGYGYTSYDYTYRNSYSYNADYGNVVRWDYATSDWNETSSSLASNGAATELSTWYSSTLHSDGYGTHTSYDYTYGNSYSYNTNYGTVSKWDYSSWDWNTSSSSYSSGYDPDASTWYSTYLQSDGYGTHTSYDYSYYNSYSYNTAYGDVSKWDYTYSNWNTSSSAYTYGYDPSLSSWYSSTLHSDGYGYTSYDYTYTNSYSYDTSYGEVVRWDYATSDWNVTHNNLRLANPVSEAHLKKVVNLAYVDESSKKNPMLNLASARPIIEQPAQNDATLFVSGLVLATLTVLSVALNKCKKQRSKDGFLAAESSSVSSVHVSV